MLDVARRSGRGMVCVNKFTFSHNWSRGNRLIQQRHGRQVRVNRDRRYYDESKCQQSSGGLRNGRGGGGGGGGGKKMGTEGRQDNGSGWRVV
jgi:hypothetical protein